MRDLFGEEAARFAYLEDQAKKIFPLYGFSEVRTPILEPAGLFAKGVGEETDIVGKEMYLLQDRNGQALALRPEGTASVVRAVANANLMKQSKQQRLFYFGPMFRYERPQKGRFRQFYQIGVELFGVAGPEADFELLLLLRQYFAAINLQGVAFQLNSIGCGAPACRPAYKAKLIGFLSNQRQELCEDCQRRLEQNPLRVLDCKQPGCIALTIDAPQSHQHLCQDCDTHFSQLQSYLQQAGVSYSLNPKLVRGLDYYSRTVFEVYSSNLGAQSAAGGGGRFDDLFAQYGADATPAVGFALGLDRLAMLAELPATLPQGAFVIGFDKNAVMAEVARLREAGLTCHYDPDFSSMKSQFKQADKAGVAYAVILGEEELANGQATVKHLATGEQERLTLEKMRFKLAGN